MLHIVTVPGGNGVTIAIPFNSSDSATIASMLLQELYATPASEQHVVRASNGTTGSGAVPGDVNFFLADQVGTAVVPNGYQYLADAYDLSSNYGGMSQPHPAPATSFLAAGNLNGASINSEAGAVTYNGGTGFVSIVGGNPITAADVITIAAPSANSGGGVVDLEDGGTENLTLASGNWNITTGTGTGTLVMGSGSDTVAANGTQTIRGGSGAGVDSLFGAHEQVIGGSGKTQIYDHGISDNIAGGLGASTVFASGSGLQVTGGGGEVLFIDLTGGNTVTGGSSGLVIFGASDKSSTFNGGHNYVLFVSEGGADTVNAAAGTNAPVVYGFNGCDVHLNSATQGAFFVGGSGSETIDARNSTQGVIFYAGVGATDMIGSPNAPNFYAASTGPSTMSGGIGNLYEFIDHHAGSNNLITDFTSSDGLYLSGFGSGAQDGIVSETIVNGMLNMKLNDGTTIVFQNISNTAQLNGHIFHI